MFVPSLVEIGQVVLEKKMKIWKINRWTEWQTNRQTTEKRQSEKLTFISGEVKNYFASCLASSILKLGTGWLPILHTMIYVRFSIITSHNLDWKFMQVHKNKRPMGHIAHLKKQFKSINTYDYIITLINRRKKTIIKLKRIYWFFIWRNLNPYHPRMLVRRLIEIG